MEHQLTSECSVNIFLPSLLHSRKSNFPLIFIYTQLFCWSLVFLGLQGRLGTCPTDCTGAAGQCCPAPGAKKGLKLCFLHRNLLKMNNAVKGNAGKSARRFGGLVLLPPRWLTAGPLLNPLSFLPLMNKGSRAMVAVLGRIPRSSISSPGLPRAFFEKSAVFLGATVPIPSVCQTIWTGVVVYHEFIKALALLARRRARMLEWTQLSENLIFSLCHKDEIMEALGEVWGWLKFGGY